MGKVHSQLCTELEMSLLSRALCRGRIAFVNISCRDAILKRGMYNQTPLMHGRKIDWSMYMWCGFSNLPYHAFHV